MSTNRCKIRVVIRNLTIVLSLCVPISSWSACAKEDRNQFHVNGHWLSTYSSMEGNKSNAVAMTISLTQEKMEAVLFDPGINANVIFSGQIFTNGQFRLVGHSLNNSNEEIKAEGSFVETDPRGGGAKLNCDVIALKMMSAKETKTFLLAIEHEYSGRIGNRYFAIGSNNDSLVEENAISFVQAIRTNNRKAVTNLVNYPFEARFMRGDKMRHRMMHTSKELLEQYDQVFPQSVIDGISSSRPYHMFVTQYGYAILGYGYVGFSKDGRVAYVLSYMK